MRDSWVRGAIVACALTLAACRRDDGGSASATSSGSLPHQWVSVTVTLDPEDAVEPTAEEIEQLVAAVPGLEAMRTELSDAQAITWLAFAGDGEPVTAVQAAVAAGLRSLPGSAIPIVQRHRPGEADAWLLLQSNERSAIDLAAVAHSLREGLSMQPGVHEVRYCGPAPRTMLEVDPVRLEAYGLTPQEVLTALRSGGLDLGESAEQLLEQPVGDARVRDFTSMRVEGSGSCSVRTAGGGTGIALQVRYQKTDSDLARGIADHVAAARAGLPPGVGLEHEPISDAPAVQPRVQLMAARPEALGTFSWPVDRGSALAWMIAHDDGRAEIVGLADAAAATSLATALSSTPGLAAVAEVEPWASIAVMGPELERLAERASRVVEVLARAGTPAWRPSPPSVPEVEIRIDRARAADLGIDVKTIRDTIALHDTDGIVLARGLGDLREPIVVRVATRDPGPAPWQRARVRGASGMVPLESLVEAVLATRPARLERCNRMRCITIDVPAAAARALDLAALGRDVELAAGETLAVIPRPP